MPDVVHGQVHGDVECGEQAVHHEDTAGAGPGCGNGRVVLGGGCMIRSVYNTVYRDITEGWR